MLDAEPGAELVYGWKHDMTREAVRRSVQEGTIEGHVRKIPVQTDDVFYVEAGTVHAIGAGVLIAEIQESSDLTYRLYDYQRVDKNGRARSFTLKRRWRPRGCAGRRPPGRRPGCSATGGGTPRSCCAAASTLRRAGS